MDTITAEDFRVALGETGWRAGIRGARITYRTGDFATGARLFTAIAGFAEHANHHPDVDVAYATVSVRLYTHSAKGLTQKDVDLARQITTAAQELDVEPDPSPPQRIMIAVTTPDEAAILPFWEAVTGYDAVRGRNLVDPTGAGPLIWLQHVDRPIGGRMHLDVVVPPDETESRVAAALAAGGVMVDESHAPQWWTLADADGHKVDISPSRA